MKSYSLRSNYQFVYTPLLRHKKKIALLTLAEAVFFVMVPVVGMMITSMIIGSLEQGISVWNLVLRILLAFAGYGVLNMVKGYLDARGDGHYIEVRTELFIMSHIEKDLTISMEQYENAEIQRLKEKANDCMWANTWGVEGFFRHNSDLLKSVLGLVVYALLVGSMSWKILLLLIVISAASALAAYWVTRYYEKIKDPLSEQHMTMNYINREVDGSLSGGELKRIEIATVLARDTRISVFDEPEAGIDLWSFHNLIRVFEKMHRNKERSIVIISHQERILGIADEIVVIADGTVKKKGSREEILPELLEAAGGGCRYYRDMPQEEA